MANTFYWSSTSSTDPTVGANWTKDDGTTGNVPASGDVAFVQALQTGTAAAVSTTTSQLAVTLAALYIDSSHAAGIGSATSEWAISANNIFVRRTSGSGSGRIKINHGGVETKIYVETTGSASSDNNRAVARFRGTNTANAVYVTGGSVGLAASTPGESAVYATIIATGNETAVTIGGGVTWTTLQVSGAGVLLNAPAPTGQATVLAGNLTAQFVGSLGTLTAIGGTSYLNQRAASGDDVGQLNLRGGLIDLTQNPDGFSATQTSDGGGTIVAATPAQVTLGTISKSWGDSTTHTSSFEKQ